jgi:hypothetical protein
LKDKDSVRVSSGGVESWSHGVGESIFRGQQNHTLRRGRGLFIGQRVTLGDAGGEVERDRAFAEAGVSVEYDELASREVAGP